MPLFQTELDFQSWFRLNLGRYGFTHALEEHRSRYKLPYPDYWCVMPNMTVKRVEIELLASTFLTHTHDPAGADLIICAEDNSEYYGVTMPLPVVELPDTAATALGTTTFRNPRCLHQMLMLCQSAKLLPRLLRWRQPHGVDTCYYCGAMIRDPWRLHVDCLNLVRVWTENRFEEQRERLEQLERLKRA